MTAAFFASIGTNPGHIISLVYVGHSRDLFFKHDIYEQSEFIETHVGLNDLCTTQFLAGVVKKHHQSHHLKSPNVSFTSIQAVEHSLTSLDKVTGNLA